MSFNGDVAVVAGKICPISSFEYTREREVADVASFTLGTNTVATGMSITGSLESRRPIRVRDKPEPVTIYLFSDEVGRRYIFTDVLFTSSDIYKSSETQSLDFIADSIEVS